MNPCAPDDEQHDADQDQREAQAGPKTEGSPAAMETQPSAKREADDPVRGEMAEHRSARVAQATQRAGGNSLQAIKKLKSSASREQKNRAVNNGFIRRVSAGNPAGNDEEDYAHAGHERSTKQDGGTAGVYGSPRILAPDGLANTDRGSGRNTERNHVSERDGVQGNLMASERDGAEPADQRRYQGKDADLKCDLHGCRESESKEAAYAAQLGLHGSVEQTGAVAPVIPE